MLLSPAAGPVPLPLVGEHPSGGDNLMPNEKPGLQKAVLFSLFATSYTPLFVLVIAKQLSQNIPEFDASLQGWRYLATLTTHFGLSVVFGLVAVLGCGGLWIFLRNIRERAETNAFKVKLKSASNRSGEAISYIGTYILPLVLEQYKDWYETLAMLFLLLVMYRIYVNSSLLLINPLLSIWYSLYDITFAEKGTSNNKSGMLIIRSQQIDDGDEIRIYPLGNKLYFGVDHGQTTSSPRTDRRHSE